MVDTAARNGHRDSFAYVLDKYVAEVTNFQMLSHSMETACKLGHLGIVEELCAKVPFSHLALEHPLRTAVEYGHLDIVKFFIERSSSLFPMAKINARFIPITSVGDAESIEIFASQFFAEEPGGDLIKTNENASVGFQNLVILHPREDRALGSIKEFLDLCREFKIDYSQQKDRLSLRISVQPRPFPIDLDTFAKVEEKCEKYFGYLHEPLKRMRLQKPFCRVCRTCFYVSELIFCRALPDLRIF